MCATALLLAACGSEADGGSQHGGPPGGMLEFDASTIGSGGDSGSGGIGSGGSGGVGAGGSSGSTGGTGGTSGSGGAPTGPYVEFTFSSYTTGPVNQNVSGPADATSGPYVQCKFISDTGTGSLLGISAGQASPYTKDLFIAWEGIQFGAASHHGTYDDPGVMTFVVDVTPSPGYKYWFMTDVFTNVQSECTTTFDTFGDTLSGTTSCVNLMPSPLSIDDGFDPLPLGTFVLEFSCPLEKS